jgi:hypothetical protein
LQQITINRVTKFSFNLLQIIFLMKELQFCGSSAGTDGTLMEQATLNGLQNKKFNLFTVDLMLDLGEL